MTFFDLSAYEGYEPTPSVPLCGSCGFFQTCSTPKFGVVGSGEKEVLIVAPFPTKREDISGEAFSSGFAKRLSGELSELGVDLRKDCWLTYSLICKPDKQPTEEHANYCRPTLIRTIEKLQPKVIVLLGTWPMRSLVGHLWKESPGPLNRWVGWNIPSQDLNAWVAPTWSVQDIRRYEEEKNTAPTIWWRQHLKNAFSKIGGRPWEQVPAYDEQVLIENNSEKAAAVLDEMRASGKPIALDYETTCLQPEGRDSEIITAAVCCGGDWTIAYNWHGKAVEATSKLLQSPCPKIAANATFERRWTWEKLRHGIRNVVWDVIDSAHWIDNRRDTTSVKFQSFVMLGHPAYDEWIKPYMSATGGYTKNQLQLMDRQKLLLYNGLDSILEYKIAEKQMEIAGYAPCSL